MSSHISDFATSELSDYNSEQMSKYDAALEAIKSIGVADIQDFALQLSARYADDRIKPIIFNLREAIFEETFGTLGEAYIAMDCLIDAATSCRNELDAQMVD